MSTIDTEALPQGEASDHVERLVWGRFDGEHGEEFGIGRMMDIADQRSMRFTFLLDVCETELYGDRILEPGREIVARGHDLEMHAHPRLLPASWWQRRGYDLPAWMQDQYDARASRMMIEEFAELLASIRGEPPCAYRAGSYRFNGHILESLANNGIRMSFNNCQMASARSTVRTIFHDYDVFRWDNGVLEVSTSPLRETAKKQHFSFPKMSRTAVPISEHLERFFAEDEQRTVAVLVLHSWSFLYKDRETSHLRPRDGLRVEDFERFLDELPSDISVVTADELEARLSARLDTLPVVPTSRANLKPRPLVVCTAAPALHPPGSPAALSQALADALAQLQAQALSQAQQAQVQAHARNSITQSAKSEDGTLPEEFAIVIGGMRCGSTAMVRHLGQHPQLCAFTKRELGFFSADENWDKGFDWYRGHWSDFDPAKHRYALEKSTHYTKLPAYLEVPQRMRAVGARFKLIYIIRDPIDRIESHLAFNAAKGRLDFAERDKVIPYALNLSRFGMQLDHFQTHFPECEILLVDSRDLKASMPETMSRCWAFLDIDPTDEIEVVTPNDRRKLVNAASYRLTSSERRELAKELRDDVERLRRHYGVRTEAWSSFQNALR